MKTLNTSEELETFLAETPNLSIDIDKRDKPHQYTVKNNDCDLLALTTKEAFDSLRAEKKLGHNTMNFAWRSERGWHEFSA